MSDIDAAIHEARQRQDRDQLAILLARRANDSIQSGQMQAARADLDEAASLHAAADRAAQQARSLHLAATVSRFTRDLDGARQRAQAALTLAPDGSPMAVAAATELGETAMASERPDEAVKAYARALQHAGPAQLQPVPRGALLRAYARALASAGRPEQAARRLAESGTAFASGGDQSSALRVAAEQATAWVAAGKDERASQVVDTARAQAQLTHDAIALSEIETVRSAIRVRARDLPGAREAARAAQSYALEAHQPLAYTTSTIAISDLSEHLGDHEGAYEALAVGWVTLGELMGEDTSRVTFAPRLQSLRERWGDARFDQVEQAVEARHRRR